MRQYSIVNKSHYKSKKDNSENNCYTHRFERACASNCSPIWAHISSNSSKFTEFVASLSGEEEKTIECCGIKKNQIRIRVRVGNS